MTSSLMEHKGSILGAFLILLYFTWMDIALYYNIQDRQPLRPSSSTQSASVAHKGLQGLFSPFKGLTTKMMMMDPANHYIHIPAATIFNEVTQFSTSLPFITPNMISIMHVFVAILAAKFVSSQTLLARQIGVLLFEFRSFLDSLDGVIARARRKQELIISDFGSLGYIVDGVTDAAGVVALMIGCLVFLRKSQLPRRTMGKLNLSSVESAIVGSSPSNSRRILVVILCFSFQIIISSFFWDRYISGYHMLLENMKGGEQQLVWQNEQLKSALMWIIIWFWRMANAHALLEMVLFSVFINRLWEFLGFIQYIGFICLFLLISITELHFNDVANHVSIFSSSNT